MWNKNCPAGQLGSAVKHSIQPTWLFREESIRKIRKKLSCIDWSSLAQTKQCYTWLTGTSAAPQKLPSTPHLLTSSMLWISLPLSCRHRKVNWSNAWVCKQRPSGIVTQPREAATCWNSTWTSKMFWFMKTTEATSLQEQLELQCSPLKK